MDCQSLELVLCVNKQSAQHTTLVYITRLVLCVRAAKYHHEIFSKFFLQIKKNSPTLNSQVPTCLIGYR